MHAHADTTYTQRNDPWTLVYFLFSILIVAISAVVFALYETLTLVFANGATSTIDSVMISTIGIITPIVPLTGLVVGMLLSYKYYSRYGRWSTEFDTKEEVYIPRECFTQYVLYLIIGALPFIVLRTVDFLQSTTTSLLLCDLFLSLFGGFALVASAGFLWDYYDLHAIARGKGGILSLYLTSEGPTPLTTTVLSPIGGHRFQLLDPRVKYVHIQILVRSVYVHDASLPYRPADGLSH
ncbi:MAG: hypothetical protein K9W43_09335 [Candidatus Thorarchaeota archaeon]|nr:hypothetical protein [Candidatus Thorarchaeota archaeon]